MNKKSIQPLWFLIAGSVGIGIILCAGFALHKFFRSPPLILATDWYSGDHASLREISHDSATWSVDFTQENTIILDGQSGQNPVFLSAKDFLSATYVIYLPNGDIYDSGTRSVYDSQSIRLHVDNGVIWLTAPFTPGEYIYEIVIVTQSDERKYGLRMNVTGKTSIYDEALSLISSTYENVLSADLLRIEPIVGHEQDGDCFIFVVNLPEKEVEIAISKNENLYEFRNPVWVNISYQKVYSFSYSRKSK